MSGMLMLMRTNQEPNEADREAADVLVSSLFGEHKYLLKRYFSRRTRQQGKVDDLVQEAFLRFRHALYRTTVARVRNPVGLLYSIAGHVLIDQFRREIPGAHKSLENLTPHFPDPAMGLEEWVCKTETLQLREEIVNALPEQQRQVVQLRVEGATPAEIAELMHISVGRVYRLLNRASERCQRKWRQVDLFFDDGTP
jgi:RNA polymerase sigma factor (sigma-70 family)